MEIGSKNMILALAFGPLHAWGGFEVWLLKGCDPSLCFPMAFENVSSRNPEILMSREAVKILSRRNLEISMDQESIEMLSRRQRARKNSSMDWETVEDLSRKEKEGSIERESIEDLSRSRQAWRKGVFQREKNKEINAISKLLNKTSKRHIKLSKLISNKMQSIHKSNNTYTH